MNAKHRANAQQTMQTRLWSSSKTASHLTDFAERSAAELWQKATNQVVVALSAKTWLVYVPATVDSSPLCLIDPIPTWYRCRKVEYKMGKYLSCTCGLSARMKWPCHHILSVLQTSHHSMYGIRWHSTFQYLFEKPGYELQTDLFRKILEEEWKRDFVNGEHILWEPPLPDHLVHCAHYPILVYKGCGITNSTMSDDELIQLALNLDYWSRSGLPIMRGDHVQPRPNDNVLSGSKWPNSFTSPYGNELDVKLSSRATGILDRNDLSQSQQETLSQPEVTKQCLCDEVMAKARCMLELVQDKPQTWQSLLQGLDILHNQILAESTSLQPTIPIEATYKWLDTGKSSRSDNKRKESNGGFHCSRKKKKSIPAVTRANKL
jgi:hypothetical protein